ncbi:MAG: helix-turn-helix transcriptional regulator [Lachnospiraceae bacterium]|nr:helix-turn-helix transcriptional regulator [Lachnospiraceae bacterium]
MESLTERLAFLMKRENIRAVDLAEAVSVNASTVSRILKGTQMPASDTLYKIARYFQVSMEYLMAGEERAPGNCVAANFNREEAMLLEYYKEMGLEDQEELLMIARMKAAKGKKGGQAKSALSERDNGSADTA